MSLVSKTDGTWKTIKEYLDDRLVTLRIENDADLSKKETNEIRGKIEFIKEMLDLENDPEEKIPAENYDT